MKQVFIVITSDYELFGDGSGDVKNCMIAPSVDLMNVCDKHEAVLTSFVEMCEYWAFKKYADELEDDLGYQPHLIIEDQLREMIRRGHDVQLHFHPQWLNAVYDHQQWMLNQEWWRLPFVPHGLGSKDDLLSLRGLFFKGKKDLNTLLQMVHKEYECIAFRAGGYCIQPEKNVLKAMREQGLWIDSTVHKGGYRTYDPFYYDFRTAADSINPWWVTPDDINKRRHERNTVLEIPIFTAHLPVYKRIVELSEYLFSKEDKKSYGCQNYLNSKDHQSSFLTDNQLVSFLKPSLLKKPFIWNYCTQTEKQIEILFKCGIKQLRYEKQDQGVFVMTGHPKSLKNPSYLDKFLSNVSSLVPNDWKISFVSISQLGKQWRKNDE